MCWNNQTVITRDRHFTGKRIRLQYSFSVLIRSSRSKCHWNITDSAILERCFSSAKSQKIVIITESSDNGLQLVTVVPYEWRRRISAYHWMSNQGSLLIESHHLNCFKFNTVRENLKKYGQNHIEKNYLEHWFLCWSVCIYRKPNKRISQNPLSSYCLSGG